MCCGGWMIVMEGDDQFYNFGRLPASSKIDLENATFPLPVKVKWHREENLACRLITIDDIELDE